MPPSTAAVNDQPELEPGVVADGCEAEEEEQPGCAAECAGEANVNEIVRFTLIPIIAEASRSWAVCMAFPWRVDWTSHVSQEDRDGEPGSRTLVPGELDAEDLERDRVRDPARHRTEVHVVERERDVLDDERHSDRGDERGQARRAGCSRR